MQRNEWSGGIPEAKTVTYLSAMPEGLRLIPRWRSMANLLPASFRWTNRPKSQGSPSPIPDVCSPRIHGPDQEYG